MSEDVVSADAPYEAPVVEDIAGGDCPLATAPMIIAPAS